jgi:biotin transport system substrate-specific component
MEAAPITRTGLSLTLVPAHATLVDKAILAVAASVLVAICAHLSVPLWFTPVPLTLGNMAVILVGLTLGPSVSFAAMVLYLCQGALGLPVFNPGGPGGIAQLLGPTGGYLFAYPLAAALAGAIAETMGKRASKFTAGIVASALGTGLVMLMGFAWLTTLLHLTLRTGFQLGTSPFLPGEALKVLAAAGLYSAIRGFNA